MSLSPEEQRRTSAELHANLDRCGLGPGEIRADLGMSAHQLNETLAVSDDARPTDVWLVRDYLEKLVVARGGTPVPYTVLTERMRQVAASWYPLRTAPTPVIRSHEADAAGGTRAAALAHSG
ncbi:DUF2316 family protein [Agromyces sp. SYSU T00194]|uniref:DUF2316 family protein n=1 Tax=Agromyces chitinivorans TaxID=3158560 RepID=UPI003396BD63